MTVISFSERATQTARADRLDWTNQEIADFYQAQRVLRQQGVGVGIDRGVTDLGEPWLVLFDDESQDVFVHIARIDRRCILVSEALGLKVEADTVAELISSFETSVRALVHDRSGETSNVVLHPTARIILSLALLILLLKFDGNNPAVAEDAKTDTPDAAGDHIEATDATIDAEEANVAASPVTPELDAVRRADILSRAQAFLARTADAMPIDAPTAMAGAAQLMLLAAMSDLEAAENRQQQAKRESDNADPDAPVMIDETVQSAEASAAGEAAAQGAVPANVVGQILSTTEGFETVIDEYRPAEAGAGDMSRGSLVLTAAGDRTQIAQRDDLVNRDGVTVDDKPLPEDESRSETDERVDAEEQNATEVAAEPEPEPILPVGEPLAVASESSLDLDNAITTTLDTTFVMSDNSLEVSEQDNGLNSVSTELSNPISTSLASQVFGQLNLPFQLQQQPVIDIVSHDDLALDMGGSNEGLTSIDVAIASLDNLIENAGFVRLTDVGSDGISQTLRTTLAAFDDAEVEFSGGNVLIEQAGADDAAAADLGVWVNTLSDDSQIIIVGQAALVDSLQTAVLG